MNHPPTLPQRERILISRLEGCKAQLCEGYGLFFFFFSGRVLSKQFPVLCNKSHFWGNKASMEADALAHAYSALDLPEQDLS